MSLIESLKQQHSFELEIFSNNINVFPVYFDQYIVFIE